MKLVLRPALAGILLLTLAACAGNAAEWTAPPDSPVPSAAPSEAASPSAPASGEPFSSADSSAAPSAAPSGVPSSADPSAAPTAAPPTDAPSGGPSDARTIELQLTTDLRIKQGDTVVADIPVTPGEHIRFHLDNTAGFIHNFYIGTDQQLAGNQVDGLAGIPQWESGVMELDWVVPADITGLKFGCTLTGHYSTMNGTFSVAS